MTGWQLRQLNCLCCRNTYKLPLPVFMLNTGSTPTILFHVYVVKRFGRDQHKVRLNHRAEFYLLYCKFSGLCNTCGCTGTTLCNRLSYGGTTCETQSGVYPTKLRVQLLLMPGESGGSMQVSACNSKSCAWILNALCACLIWQQLAMLHCLVPWLRDSSLLAMV